MNRLIWVIICIFLGEANCLAQTYYYKLTKTIIKGQQNTSVNGGQFITFDGKKCFESDKYGKNVGNGSLVYDAENSRVNETFWGACYYSKNAYFKFNSDRSLLNIDTNSGKIYVYKRATPPSGVTTCSLIRDNRQKGAGGGGTVVIEEHGPQQVWVPCGGCNGSGKCGVCGGRGYDQFSLTNNSRLSPCMGCRYSGKCEYCGGTGGHYEMR